MLSGFFTGNRLSPPVSNMLSSTLELDPNTPPSTDTGTGTQDSSENVPEQVVKHNIRYTGKFVTITPPVTILNTHAKSNRYFDHDSDTDSSTDSDEPSTTEAFKVLCDTNGMIEWMLTGITYRGEVQNDRIVFGKDDVPKGKFTVPENTLVSYRGGKGILTFDDESNQWTLTFKDWFYIRSITSVDFDPYTLTFLKKKLIVFSDGCVSDFRKSHDYHGYRNVYYTPRPKLTNSKGDNSNNESVQLCDANKWSNHQLLLWLRTVYNFYDDVYDNISVYNITGLQWSQLSSDALWELGLNNVEISQVITDRSNINLTITLHNTLNDAGC